MLVWLYEVVGERRTERRVSVELSIDYVYWFERSPTDRLGKVKQLRIYTKRMLLCDGLRWQAGQMDDPQQITDRGGGLARERSPDDLSWRIVTEDDWRDDRRDGGRQYDGRRDDGRRDNGGRQDGDRRDSGRRDNDRQYDDSRRNGDRQDGRGEDGRRDDESRDNGGRDYGRRDDDRRDSGNRDGDRRDNLHAHERRTSESRMRENLMYGLMRDAEFGGEGISEQQIAALHKKLSGRRLLLEEVRRLSMDMGLLTDEADGRLRSILQWLWLEGNIRYDAGMVLEETVVDRLTDWFYYGRRDVAYRRRLRCGRCNSRSDKHYSTECATCGRSCVYCEACLQMGRVRECSVMVIGHEEVDGGRELVEAAGIQEIMEGGRERDFIAVGGRGGLVEADGEQDLVEVGGERSFMEIGGRQGLTETYGQQGLVEVGDKRGIVENGGNIDLAGGKQNLIEVQHGHMVEVEQEALLGKWGLSPAQRDASAEALAFIEQPAQRDGEQFLIWAVTGAGKTEMVYPLVEYMLHKGRRVLLTAPRRDVVLELAPRLAKAFPEREVIALYGGSEHRWEIGEITVATTHQLLRLDRCFDLVVLDELDAYPYHNNPMLAHAARRACKASGKTVLLTATPPPEQKRAMRQRRLPHAMVPVRYHRHPLPEPRILRYRGLGHTLGAGRLPSALRAALDESLQRGAQIFVFVPRIEHVEPLKRLLRMACADAVDTSAAVDGTSSRDAERAERVRRFRSGEIRILVTTTILERGVTIPRSDVYVLDADAALFDEAALVQMAGRAGRSADDPCGRVYYVARERTDGTQLAVRHIRAMNALARKRGLLRDEARTQEVRDARSQSHS